MVRTSSETPRVVIVGAGFAGICMGIRLKQAGIDSFTIYERAASIGGTWRDNDYPGAACDVPSHLYSFSFEPKPDWANAYAKQPEIRQYLHHCVDKYGLRKHIRCGEAVTSLRLDEATGRWTVDVGGRRVEADRVVLSTGFLSTPALPDIPGLDRYAGKVFHSSRWDHDHPLEDKTVGVIGTGASCIQFLPAIAPRVKQLHLFQRTPPWILPKDDREISTDEQRRFRRFPWLQWAARQRLYWANEVLVLALVVSPRLLSRGQRLAREYLERSVPDEELRRKLTPQYTLGCKRILISNDYYPALLRPNVELVDTGIREITHDGVVTRDGRHRQVDTLILGTGFQATVQAPFEVRGRGGVDLRDRWRDGGEAYLGTTIAGYPNLFMIEGPNSGLGHSSMILMIEAQVAHIMGCFDALNRRRATWIDVRDDVQRTFNQGIQKALRGSVWASGCQSWYQTASGKVTTLWPGFTFTFRRRAERFDASHYRFSSIPAVAARASADEPAFSAEAEGSS